MTDRWGYNRFTYALGVNLRTSNQSLYGEENIVDVTYDSVGNVTGISHELWWYIPSQTTGRYDYKAGTQFVSENTNAIFLAMDITNAMPDVKSQTSTAIVSAKCNTQYSGNWKFRIGQTFDNHYYIWISGASKGLPYNVWDCTLEIKYLDSSANEVTKWFGIHIIPDIGPSLYSTINIQGVKVKGKPTSSPWISAGAWSFKLGSGKSRVYDSSTGSWIETPAVRMGIYVPSFIYCTNDDINSLTLGASDPKPPLPILYGFNPYYPWWRKEDGYWYYSPDICFKIDSDFEGYLEMDYNGIIRSRVDYRRNNGSMLTTINILPAQTQAGTVFTMPSVADAGTRPHYTFNHWTYLDDEGKSKDYLPGEQCHSYPKFYTVSTVWEPDTYTVSYVINQFDADIKSIPPAQYQYGKSFTLPTLTSPTADFNGWSDGTTIHTGGSSFSLDADTTLTAIFTNKTFTVTFKDVDDGGADIVESVQYPGTVNVPAKPSGRNAFEFVGWLNSNYERVISPTATTYQPTSNITVKRRYTYNFGFFNVSTSGQVSFASSGNRTYDGPMTVSWSKIGIGCSPPQGFEEYGISQTIYTPNANQDSSALSGVVVANANNRYEFNVNINSSGGWYFVYQAKTLTSITLADVFTLKVNMTKTTSPSELTLNPSDWLGSVEWVVRGGNGLERRLSDGDTYINSYFEISISGRSATLYGVSSTVGIPTPFTLSVEGRSKTYDASSSMVSSNITYISVANLFAVNFFIDERTPYNLNIEGWHTGNAWYVTDYLDGTEVKYKWELPFTPPAGVTPPAGAYFPTNPVRDGFTFIGWMDSTGKKVSEDNPPTYAITSYATWTQKFRGLDRDSLIIQKFNRAGDRIENQIDVGTVTELSERYEISISESPTPTMASINTFILDTGVSEEVSIKMYRRNPVNPWDESDDPREWSNGKWVSELRALVDRWQSDTDGIKLLYLPRGFRITTVLGDTFGYGDNYPMLGYVKDNTGSNKDDLGMLYGDNNEYKLVGYNGVISGFTDRLSGESNTVIVVSLSVTLGGMTSNYQQYRSVL